MNTIFPRVVFEELSAIFIRLFPTPLSSASSTSFSTFLFSYSLASPSPNSSPPSFTPNLSNSVSLSERRSGLGLNEELSEFPADDAAVDDDDDDNDAATLALQTAVNNLSQLSASVCI